MKIIEKGIIRLFTLICIILIYNCSNDSINSVDKVDIRLIDLFANFVDIDSNDNQIGLNQLQLIFEITNNTDKNCYLEFDNELKDRKKQISNYITTYCPQVGDSSKLNLYYITSSRLFLYGGQVDTLVLKGHFKEVGEYFDECSISEEKELREVVRNAIITYQIHIKQEDIKQYNSTFSPLTQLNQKISI